MQLSALLFWTGIIGRVCYLIISKEYFFAIVHFFCVLMGISKEKLLKNG